MSEEKMATRHRLTAKLEKIMKWQDAKARVTDLSGYTFERRKSSYRDAKADLSIFDGNGKLTYYGRQFENRFFFWHPQLAS